MASALKDFILAEQWKAQKNINVAEKDKKKEPYSKSVSHSLHILLFVWCRYWVSSEKSGLRSPRMAVEVE